MKHYLNGRPSRVATAAKYLFLILIPLALVVFGLFAIIAAVMDGRKGKPGASVPLSQRFRVRMAFPLDAPTMYGGESTSTPPPPSERGPVTDTSPAPLPNDVSEASAPSSNPTQQTPGVGT